MTPRHRIPTRRVLPRALTIIGLVILAVSSALLLTGCAPSEDSTLPERRANMFIYTDDLTGCQYLRPSGYSGFAPRMDRNGKQICK